MSEVTPKKEKKPRFMRWYPEKWLDGSIRDEMTAAQRGVWADLLCLGGRNDPPGQVDFTTTKSLARRLGISQKLLWGTLRSTEINKKIRFIKVYVDAESGQKFEEFERSLNEIDTFCEKKSKTGIPLNAIIFLDWNTRQPPYYRQKPYPKKDRGANENDQLLGPENCVMERRGNIKEKDMTEEASPSPTLSASPLPSNSSPKKAKTLKEEFLEMLRECQGYQFSEALDSLLFDFAVKEYPGITILEQTSKKITWWRVHTDALKADPRAQLKAWFAEEARFKSRGGPQKIGNVMAEVDDPDHRKWLGKLLERQKTKKEAEQEEGY